MWIPKRKCGTCFGVEINVNTLLCESDFLSDESNCEIFF